MCSHNAAERKKELRRQIRMSRRGLDIRQKAAMDQAVRERLFSLPVFSGGSGSPQMVYAYVSHGKETDTLGILELLFQRGIAVAAPRVEGERMRFYQITGFKDLTEGYRGILEPKEGCPAAVCPQAPALVPGLGFSVQGGRLGMGGGFYDRFMEAEPDHLWIGLAYEFQMRSQLPREAHDRPVDLVVTEKQIYGIA